MRSSQKRRAFSLVELLVVIAIIGILVALLLPAVQTAREAARRIDCSNRMKQMGLASQNCHDSYQYMPRFGYAWPKGSTSLKQSSTFWSLLPYMEQQNLYDRLPANQTSSAYFNSSTRLASVSAYTCPSDASGVGLNGAGAGWNLSSYNVNGMVFFDLKSPTLARITDGTSNTVTLVEHLALCRDPRGGNNATSGRSVWPAVNLTTGDSIVYWDGADTTTSFPDFPGFAIRYATAKVPDRDNGNVPSWKRPQASPSLGPAGACDPTTASSGHPGVVQVVFADGSVHGISENVSLGTWNAILAPNRGEVLGSPF